MIEPSTDAAIVELSWTDPERFGEIFERHFEAVFAFVNRAVGLSDGPDLAAETFSRAFAVRKRFDTSYASARPWLFGIAANLVAGHVRRRGRESRAVQRLFGRLSNHTDFEDEAVDRVHADVSAPALQAALRALRRDEVMIVYLFALEDFSYQEISVALGVPEGTVRSRLSRARVKLRNRMGSGGELGEHDRQ